MLEALFAAPNELVLVSPLLTKPELGATRCAGATLSQRVLAVCAPRISSSNMMLDDDEDDEKLPVVPLGDKKLRACMVTGLIKTEDQFLREGNDNVPCLSMKGDREMVMECTSNNFDGMVAVMKPSESWAARWQGVQNFVPGCYALQVKGTLPSQHVVTLEDNGIRYRSLDEAPER